MSTSFKIWALAARPKTLPASIAPVIIGTAMAYAAGKGHLLSALMALFGGVMIQIGTNFTNDYFDAVKGTDTHERLGPLRVTQAGLVTKRAMRIAIWIVFSLAILAGIYLVWRGGWPIVAIGLTSIVFAIIYTGGPYPLAYYGLGDFFVLIFFGLIPVAGTYYVQTLEMNSLVLVASIAPALFALAILTVNNVRDIETDRKAGKKTLQVRFGRTFARWEYLIAVMIAALVPLVLSIITEDHDYALAAIIVLPVALPTVRRVFRNTDGPTLNACLASTGRLLLLYSILFSIGWLL